MLVSQVMTPNVETIAPDRNLREAAQRMRNCDVGALPVGDAERLVGIITDRDLTVRATAEGRDPNTALVRDVMSTELVWCFADTEVAEAAETMEREQIRRLPVLDRDRRLVGILSLGDLSTRTGDRLLAGEITREVSQPGHSGH